jgi:hypothetical protein
MATTAPKYSRQNPGYYRASVQLDGREVVVTIQQMDIAGYVGRWDVRAFTPDFNRTYLDAGDIYPTATLTDAKAEVARWLAGR